MGTLGVVNTANSCLSKFLTTIFNGAFVSVKQPPPCHSR
jgi:hypothetical protein